MTRDVTIYHNPKCGTSRNTLELIREAGIEPTVIEYLKTPPSRDTLKALGKKAGGIRKLLREKEALCAELDLANASVSDDQILDAMVKHPILINRPIVVTSKTVKLCRPAETVKELLGSSAK